MNRSRMRGSRIFLLLFTLCSTTTFGAVIVHFTPGDYSELGKINEAIAPAIQSLSLSKADVQATLTATQVTDGIQSLAGEVLSKQLEDAGFNAFSAAVTAISTITSATNFEGGNVLKLDISKSTAALQQLNGNISKSYAALGGQFDPPSPDLTRAIAASEIARDAASDTLTLATERLAGLDPAYKSLDPTLKTLQSYRDYFSTMLKTTLAAESALQGLPFQVEATSQALLDLVSSETDLRFQLSQINSTIGQVEGLRQPIIDRAGALGDLTRSLEDALTTPPLTAHWETNGYGFGDSDAYRLEFFGASFDTNYAEINSDFLLGTLLLTNFVSTGPTAFQETLTFEADRTIFDPLSGPSSTVGYANIEMFYFATTNTSDPRASADYFWVPELGIDVSIYEGETFAVNVFGSYHSPLKVVSLEAVAGNTGGFITSAAPEPATISLFGLTAALLSLVRLIVSARRQP